MSAEALDLLHGLVLEDGRRWGEAATDVQRSDAEAVLGEGHRRHWLGRSRGYSKTTDLAGLTLAAMLELLPPRSRAYGFASDQAQAALMTTTMAELATRTPGLAGAFDLGPTRVTVKRTGTRFEALPSDASGTWGLRPWWVVLDELAWWPDTASARQVFEAITTALPKVPDSRLAIITTPSDPSHWSRAVFDRAQDEADLWRVSEVLGPAPWMPPDLVEAERRRLPEASFRRLFLGEWCAGEDALALPSDVAACAVLDGPQPYDHRRAPYVVAVDLGVKRDRSVLVVAHAEAASSYWYGTERHDEGRRVVVDRKFLWKPSKLRSVPLDEVERAILQAVQAYGSPTVVLDPWQAMGIAQRLRHRGVRVEEFTFSSASVGRLAAVLFGLLRDHRLAFDRDDTDLATELGQVRLTETKPGLFRLDHSAQGHDDQAVAVAMAAVYLLDRPAMPLRVGTIHYHGRDGRLGYVSWDDETPEARILERYRPGWEKENPGRSFDKVFADLLHPSPSRWRR